MDGVTEIGLERKYARADGGLVLAEGAMIEGYAKHFKIDVDDSLHRDALEWSTTRGARSGRVAWQFIQDLGGRLGKRFTDRQT